MRIISGKYKGKKLIGFNIEGTRPTMDRVKESLFAIIQNKIPNSICLDLFSGSGALGLEAISMGSKSCTFIDNSEQAIQTIKTNTKEITEKYEILKIDYKKFIKTTNNKYDIIFLDPPYKHKLLNKAIKYIEEYKLLNQDGIIICEYESEEPICTYNLIKEKKYGTKKIKIYKK